MNDYNSILNRLKDNMPKDIATMEGTFSGDILCAVANELAFIYSAEIDKIYEKAFVSTATGDYLTYACIDCGVERMENESDQQLRERTLTKLKNKGINGTVQGYIDLVKSFDQILGVRISKTSDGKVQISYCTQSTDDTLHGKILQKIEEEKIIGTIIDLVKATSINVNMVADITYSSDYDIDELKSTISSNVEAHLKGLTMKNSSIVVSLGDIYSIILKTDGVIDATNLKIAGQKSNLVIDDKKYPVSGTLNWDLSL